jgi:hypothetical protein
MSVGGYIKSITNDDSCGIFLPPTDAQTALNIIIEYYLGEDWYVNDPVGQEQVNTESVLSIIDRYPKSLFKRLFGISGIKQFKKE